MSSNTYIAKINQLTTSTTNQVKKISLKANIKSAFEVPMIL